jgi:hypothetical protein
MTFWASECLLPYFIILPCIFYWVSFHSWCSVFPMTALTRSRFTVTTQQQSLNSSNIVCCARQLPIRSFFGLHDLIHSKFLSFPALRITQSTAQLYLGSPRPQCICFWCLRLSTVRAEGVGRCCNLRPLWRYVVWWIWGPGYMGQSALSPVGRGTDLTTSANNKGKILVCWALSEGTCGSEVKGSCRWGP